MQSIPVSGELPGMELPSPVEPVTAEASPCRAFSKLAQILNPNLKHIIGDNLRFLAGE